jgi:hypothetical protein
MRSGRIVAAVAAVAAVAVVGVAIALSGCGSSEPSLSTEQLLSLVQEDDQIDPREGDPEFAWEPVMLGGQIHTMAGMLESLLTQWADGGGAPDECFETFIVTWGAASDGQQTDDRAGQIVYFSNGAERGNWITIDTRTFDTSADATTLLDGLPAVLAECPDGFTFAGSRVGPNGFVIDELDAPEGIRMVRVDGGVAPGEISARTVLVQRGRDIVIVDTFVFASNLDLDEIDAYALVLAERMADIPQP